MRIVCYLIYGFIFTQVVFAQDLDPRAYARVPVNISFAGLGFGYTYGNVVLDPTLPLQDLDAKLESPMIGVGHTLNLFGFTSQAYVALPYAWAQLSGKLFGVDEYRSRAGLGDMRLRLSSLLIGARPVSLEEFVKKSPEFSS